MPDVSTRAARSDRWPSADVGSAMTSRLAVSVVAVCAGYYLTGLFALVFSLSQTGIPVMWPPTAVLLAALLLAPARLWWVYLLAILPTHAHLTSHFQPGVTAAVILIQYFGHVTQVLLAGIMLRRFGGGLPRFDSLEGMTRYIAIAAIAAPAVASALAIVLFERVGWVSGFWMPWRQRFFASVIPALTVTPLIVMAAQQGVARTVLTSASRRVEFALLLAALLAVGIPVFGISVATRIVMPGLLVYALLPLLLSGRYPFRNWRAVAVAARRGGRGVVGCHSRPGPVRRSPRVRPTTCRPCRSFFWASRCRSSWWLHSSKNASGLQKSSARAICGTGRGRHAIRTHLPVFAGHDAHVRQRCVLPELEQDERRVNWHTVSRVDSGVRAMSRGRTSSRSFTARGRRSTITKCCSRTATSVGKSGSTM